MTVGGGEADNKKLLPCGEGHNRDMDAKPRPLPSPGELKSLGSRDLGAERESLIRSALEACAELTDMDLSERRKSLASLHPLVFGLVYFPHWLTCELADFHWEMSTNFRDLWRYAVCAPVGSGKTVILTKLGLLWSAFFEDSHELLLISNSSQMAEGWLDEMRIATETSDFLRYDFGSFMGTRWGSTDLEFIFRDGERMRRRCVIKGRGKGCAVRGLHPDRIVIDDPQDEGDVKTEKVRDDFSEWLRGALLTRLDTPAKKLTYVATAFDEKAYIVEILHSPPPGWVTVAYSMEDEQGHSIFPSKYPDEVLLTRKLEMGEARYAADFLNAPLSSRRGRIFHPANVTTVDGWKMTMDSYVTMTVDPAYVAGGDNWGITVVDQARSGMWYVLEAERDKTGLGPCLAAIFRMCLAYKGKIRELGVEVGGGGQESMKFNLESMARRRGVNLPPMRWLTHSSKKSKDQRVQMLLPLWESGRICLKPRHGDLREEILNYRPDDTHNDDALVDSLAMHLELQVPRSGWKPEKPTREQEIRDRFNAIRSPIERMKPRKTGLEKYLGVD